MVWESLEDSSEDNWEPLSWEPLSPEPATAVAEPPTTPLGIPDMPLEEYAKLSMPEKRAYNLSVVESSKGLEDRARLESFEEQTPDNYIDQVATGAAVGLGGSLASGLQRLGLMSGDADQSVEDKQLMQQALQADMTWLGKMGAGAVESITKTFYLGAIPGAGIGGIGTERVDCFCY